ETLLILQDELYEAELFGLLRMADVPLNNDDDERNDEGKQQQNGADKQAELRDFDAR
uniref:EB1 C-terminal domain-containing protein n=1 Tax=Globodera pallida TaxID=36090 RepID=A0A183CNC8_GLOPA